MSEIPEYSYLMVQEQQLFKNISNNLHFNKCEISTCQRGCSCYEKNSEVF